MTEQPDALRLEAMLENTLRVPARAERYVAVTDERQLGPALSYAKRHALAVTILGGASNVVLPRRMPGLVLRMCSRGIRVDAQRDAALLEVAAGENWHSLVRYSLGRGWGGLENLSLIPGSVGAAPVQNIGAYGVELGDFFEGLYAVELASGAERFFSREACELGYRSSRFRNEPNTWCITRVRLRLPHGRPPRLAYQGLTEELERQGIEQPRAIDVANAVMRIRRRKLPNPRQHPNVGSFFKNPVVTQAQFEQLSDRHGAFPAWPDADDRMKLSAAALIDRAGWKDRGTTQLGVWRRQPLVIVNEGGADGAAVLRFARQISADVQARYGVALEPEPLVFDGAT